MNSFLRVAPMGALLLLGLSACPPAQQENACGNGKIDDGEACDGTLLNDATCASQGFSYGDISCSSTCQLDTSACVNDPCWNYACGPYGTDISDTVDNLSFQPGNVQSYALMGDNDTVDLQDLYRLNTAHGGDYKAMLIFVSAGWCTYCAAEAPTLEPLYQELKDQGILLFGVVIQDNRGRPATSEFANSYAEDYGWTFPTVAGQIPDAFWGSDDESAGSVPMHLLIDLTSMRLYGRSPGVTDAKILKAVLNEMAMTPVYDAEGQRSIDFDCAPGTGNEHEPNMVDTPQIATSLPYTFTGVFCPPTIADGVVADEDVVELGELNAGTVVDVEMAPQNGSSALPFVQLLRINPTTYQTSWSSMGPGLLDGVSGGRQWVLDEDGHYILAAIDARIMSGLFYNGQTPPDNYSCCEGGADYDYSLTVKTMTLAATEPALSVGDERQDSLDRRNIKVYPLQLSANQSVTIDMIAVGSTYLDPYLSLLDSTNGAILTFNDDVDYENQNTNSQVTYTATSDQTVWIFAEYFAAAFVGTAPSYRIVVQ